MLKLLPVKNIPAPKKHWLSKVLSDNDVLPDTAMYNQVPSSAMVSCIEKVKHAIQTLLECVQHSAQSVAGDGPLDFEQVDACRDRLLVSLEQMERCMRACQTQFQNMIKLDTGDREAFYAHFELLRVPFKAEKAAVDGLYDFHAAIGDMILAIKAIDDVVTSMACVPETVVAVRGMCCQALLSPHVMANQPISKISTMIWQLTMQFMLNVKDRSYAPGLTLALGQLMRAVTALRACYAMKDVHMTSLINACQLRQTAIATIDPDVISRVGNLKSVPSGKTRPDEVLITFGDETIQQSLKHLGKIFRANPAHSPNEFAQIVAVGMT